MRVAPGTMRCRVSVRNRNTYANRRGTGGTGHVRGAFALLFLALLSFALGFFVLARLVPDDRAAKASENDSADAPKTNASDRIAASAADRPPAPIVHKTAIKPVTPPAPKPDDGPMIEPQDDAPAPAPVTPKPTTAPRSPATAAAPAAPTESDNPSGAVQTPRRLDGDNAAQPADPAAPRKRYHVQINLHETRETAEEEAQQIIDKGFTAQVHRVIRDGRPLYRVEINTGYKHKSNADAALAKLHDAGIESAIITER